MKREFMGIRGRLTALVVAAVIGELLLAGVWLALQRSSIMKEKEAKTRNLVEVAISTIGEYQRLEAEGKLSQAEAQRQALDAIRAMRYDGSDYFWITDGTPTMIMHALNPKLDHTDLRGYKDPAGKALFVEMAKVVADKGEGFVSYEWPKPGATHPSPKLSYVRGFQPWGWVVGTGMYVDDVDATWWKDARIAFMVTFLGLVLLAGIALPIARSTLRELGGEPRAVALVARAIADGDLAENATKSKAAEDSLMGSMNRMRRELRESINSIVLAVQQLAGFSEELSNTSGSMAQGSEVQRDGTTHAATAIQEMLSTILHISDHSQKAAEAARQTAEHARAGGEIVSRVLGNMGSICDSFRGSATKIEELGRRSDQIGHIVNVIDDIADQTNLLALNAAIEAARAGSQGRGFTVVADEVRKLADRTTKATKEISAMIFTIQQETQVAVENMKANTEEVELGLKITREASDSLQAIIAQAQSSGDMVTQIATAAAEQSAVTEEMNTSLNRVAEITGEFSGNAQQVAIACQELSRLSHDLQALTRRFKLGQENAAGDGTAEPGFQTSAERTYAPMPLSIHDRPHAGVM